MNVHVPMDLAHLNKPALTLLEVMNADVQVLLNK